MEKKKESKRKLSVRIMCLILAIAMVASTVLYVLVYAFDFFKGL